MGRTRTGTPCLRCSECRRASQKTTRARARAVEKAMEGPTVCRNGLHVLTEDNVIRDEKRGVKKECRECKRLRNQRARDANKDAINQRRREQLAGIPRPPVNRPAPLSPEEQRDLYNWRKRRERAIDSVVKAETALGGDLSKADDNRPGAVWNVVKPVGKSLEALNTLTAAQDAVIDAGGSWHCKDDPGPWMDSWLDAEEPVPPARNRAAQMCADCPLLVQCGAYGMVSRDPGVWGGVVVLPDGRIIK
jgi:hypothetical protein